MFRQLKRNMETIECTDEKRIESGIGRRFYKKCDFIPQSRYIPLHSASRGGRFPMDEIGLNSSLPFFDCPSPTSPLSFAPVRCSRVPLQNVDSAEYRHHQSHRCA